MEHLGKTNPNYDYFIKDGKEGHKSKTTIAEKDFGVIMDPNLNFDTHINETIKKANKVAGLINRSIVNKYDNVMIPLFKALVRPILEYGNVVWSPHLKKHKESIENVQRRFTKRVIGISTMSYEERLKQLRLPSLEYRRFRGDLIEVFKIVHNFYDPATTNNLFTFSDVDSTRGHNLKLKMRTTNTTLFNKFFTNRIIKAWNKLTTEAVNASSLNAFKNSIDRYFKDSIHSVNLDFI